MNAYLETIYMLLNFWLIAYLFLLPLNSDFNLINFLLMLFFIAISGAFFLYNRWLKKNPTRKFLPQLQSYPFLNDYVQLTRVDIGNFFPYVLPWFLIRNFLFDICYIPSGSMQPTFLEHDRVLLNRNIYGLRCPIKNSSRLGGKDPKKGDIVCFFPPTGTKNVFVKRVIGVAGDTVMIKGNAITVIPRNGDKENAKQYLLKTTVAQRAVDKITTISQDITALKEDNGNKYYFIQNLPIMIADSLSEKTWEVPENCYFVMGDNRSDSQDSRSFGPVPRENIIAAPMITLWNYQWMNNEILPTIQWKRIFRFIR